MHVGRRVARLRAAHGESLREAAIRTGVSHTTIARIEKGEVTGSFHGTLRKIADGYGVRLEYLLTGRDPRQDFEETLRRLPAEERARLYFASASTRVRLVLDFLLAEYPNEFSLEQLAKAMYKDSRSAAQLLEQWKAGELPPEAERALTEAISRLTGIAPSWFSTGMVGTEITDQLPRETMGAYMNQMRRAARAGIPPHVLEMAIDLLILKQKEPTAATKR